MTSLLFYVFSCKQCSCVFCVMGKKPLLRVAKRAEIVVLAEFGLSERETGNKVHVSKTAVHKSVSKFNISGKHTDLKRSGRTKKDDCTR